MNCGFLPHIDLEEIEKNEERIAEGVNKVYQECTEVIQGHLSSLHWICKITSISWCPDGFNRKGIDNDFDHCVSYRIKNRENDFYFNKTGDDFQIKIN